MESRKRCEVCGRSRHEQELGYAKHRITRPSGEVEVQTVAYCGDEPNCEGLALRATQSELVLRRTSLELGALRATLDGHVELWRFRMGTLGVVTFGLGALGGHLFL